MNYDLEMVERSRFPAEYRRSLARYYSALPEEARIHAHSMCCAMGQSAEEAYLKFLDALRTMRLSESRRGEHDEQTEGLGTAIRLWRTKGVRRNKPNIKTAFIRLHYHELKDLRENGLSWRGLETYLYEKYKVKIGFSFLRRIFADTTYEGQFRKEAPSE
jgi:hypothetical protein